MAAWTDKEDELLKALLARGDSYSQIASQFTGRSPQSITGRIHRLGLAEGTVTTSVRHLSIQYGKATALEIAEALGMDLAEVRRALSKLGIRRAPGSEETYRPTLVAKMRADLMSEVSA